MNLKETLKTLLTAAAAALLVYVGTGWITPVYEAEMLLFVPAMTEEKLIAQGGFGFGGPAEVDAHLDIVRSRVVMRAARDGLAGISGDTATADAVMRSLKAERTPNGGLKLSARAADPDLAVRAVQLRADSADARKSRMLSESRRAVAEQARIRYTYKLGDVQRHRNTLDSLTGLLRQGVADFTLRSLVREYEVRLERAVDELAAAESQKQRLIRAVDLELPRSYAPGPPECGEEPVSPQRIPLAVAVFAIVFATALFLRFISRERGHSD